MEIFEAAERADKRKVPAMKKYRILTEEECRNLHGHALILDANGRVASVKITSVNL